MTRASIHGGYSVVDMVTTMPRFLVSAPIRPASGIGSFFGERVVYIISSSIEPPNVSGTVTESSSMMKSTPDDSSIWAIST